MTNSPQSASVNQALVAALPYPLYVVDRNSVVREANPSALELGAKLGLGKDLPRELRLQVEEAIKGNQKTGAEEIRRAEYLSGDQRYLPQIFRLVDVFDGQDGWAVLLVDVTSRGERVETNAKTLSALSHEVRTPLTSIRMSLHLLLEEKVGALNPNQRELLEVGRDECEQMLATVQTLLASARRENGSRTAFPADDAG